jgi:hypothetical protein
MAHDPDADARLAALLAGQNRALVYAELRSWATQTTDPELRARLWREAGQLVLDRFANQAEAIGCFEASLEARRDQPEVEDRLRDLYRQRRSWQTLLPLCRSDEERAEVLAHLEPKSWWRRLIGGQSR